MRRYVRQRRRSHSDGGSSWISYSDMMASLILLFVLVLCYSMYQYFQMLETKTQELDAQSALLSEQSIILASQQEELEGKQIILIRQEEELSQARTALDEQQALLVSQQAELDSQQQILILTQSQLTEKETALTQKEAELEAANVILIANQQELETTRAQLSEQQIAMQTQQQKLDRLVGVRTQIVRDLTDALQKANIKATVDKNTGDIMLESSVFFELAKSTITESGRAFLDRFVPVYLDVLLKADYADYLGEIIIEGHTDPTGTYLNNLKLSQERALAVATYCLQMDSLTEEQRAMLQRILTAKGRSDSDLIFAADGTVDNEASRRVEFKFRMKDSEMIDEIRDILSETP